MEVLAVDLGCKVGELPTTYLGLLVSKSNINLGLCERNILQKTINAEKVIYFEWGEVYLDTKYVCPICLYILCHYSTCPERLD